MTDFTELLSQTIYHDKYSKFNEQEQRYETWQEAVQRVMSMHERRFAEKLAESVELRALFTRIQAAFQERLILPSMRSLQFGGEQIEKNHAKIYNCAATAIDRPRAFAEVFYALLCGTGCGFSVQKRHVEQLPPITMPRGEPIDYIIGDSIEGWADALDALMDSYFYDSHPFRFDYSRIRPKGSPVSGGIIAPGPDGLRKALESIDSLLRNIAQGSPTAPPRNDQSEGVQLTPIACYDALMHASDAVLSGGVRRSATICLFDPNDQEMMNAKTGDWLKENPQRARSNNSAILVRSETSRGQFMELAQRTKEWGEPGFIFVENPDHLFNPCSEISLYCQTADGRSGLQFCNLTECNGTAIRDRHGFLEACRTASWLGTLQAAYTDFQFFTDETREICEREALIGVSITGIMDNPMLANAELLAEGAKAVRLANKQMAELIGINPAARTTTVKPAGTTSILLGTASGIHPRHSRRYIRNVQLNRMSPVAQLIQRTNPAMVQDSVWGKDDVVVSFPITAPAEAVTRDELSAVDHLQAVLNVQKAWVAPGTNPHLNASTGLTHNCSNTLTVGDEWDAVLEAIWAARGELSGISLVPSHSDKQYPQAPHVDTQGNAQAQAQWHAIKQSAVEVDWGQLGAKHGVDAASLAGEACAGGACEL